MKKKSKKKASTKRERVLEIRLSDEEYERIAAKAAGMGVSTWARHILLLYEAVDNAVKGRK